MVLDKIIFEVLFIFIKKIYEADRKWRHAKIILIQNLNFCEQKVYFK